MVAQRSHGAGADLVERFALTPDETRLALDLAAGKSLEEIAVERKIEGARLRTQLKAILRKTGTARLADLGPLFRRLGRG